MQLKSYQIDGRLLRTGAANFSASGLMRQDIDLIVIESAEAAAAFTSAFNAPFANGEASPIGMNRYGGWFMQCYKERHGRGRPGAIT
jgi:phosphatidylserine/phosphatidylglycerophosphate/cardiolipin synthase-like enzyme